MSKRGVKKRPWLSSIVIVVFCFCRWVQPLEGACLPRNGCSTALASYTVQEGDKLYNLASRFQTTIPDVQFYNDVGAGNFIETGQQLLFPFRCGCANDILSHSFKYQVEENDTVSNIASIMLSTVDQITQANALPSADYIVPGQILQVPVECFCGNPAVSPSYGLFMTYHPASTDNLSSLVSRFDTTLGLLQNYNPSVNWNVNLTTDILFIPTKNGTNGTYPPFQFSDDGSSSPNEALIAVVSVLGVVALLLFIMILCLSYVLFSRRAKKVSHNGLEVGLVPFSGGSPSGIVKFSGGLGRSETLKFAGESQVSGSLGPSGPLAASGPLGPSGPLASGPLGRSPLSGFNVDRSVEFSFEELAAATNNFNVANKIGEGGYGAVYRATLRGQKMAVKRMNVQATREFLSELQILTHVHHTHLVQLIGYCTVESLFLIYEYVENGPLERHLHGYLDLPPLSWTARVQIALDAARGLEYIHEHTKPTYIHRDIKPSNILLDKNLRAKVADFGLTNFTETGFSTLSESMSRPMRLVGTFGYMPPEYARYGDVSPKVDVYSFGVVLFEMISAKSAIVKIIQFSGDPTIPDKEDQRSLVGMFEEVLADPHGKEALGRLVDPALEGNYPLESAWKMAKLAGDCIQENPELRPSMRTVVVALMSLSSTTENWEKSSFGSHAVITG